MIHIALFIAAVCCGQTLQSPQTAFIGGQVSPLMVARTDSPNYRFGCRELTNMQVVDVGAVTRRPGSVYVSTAQGQAVLIPFIYSDEDAYCLEFTHKLLRFYRNGGIVLGGGGTPYSIATTYDGNDLFDLQYVQSSDLMYLAHKDYPPQLLTRSGHASWTIADVNFLHGPFENRNTTTTTVEPCDVTWDIVLTASASLFDANYVGALWRIDHVVPSQTLGGTFSGTGQSASVVAGITAPYYFAFTAVAFKGAVQMQISYDEGATWTSLYTAQNADSASMDVNDSGVSDFGQNVLLRLACSTYTSGSVTYEMQVDSYVHVGIVRITDYNSPTDVNAVVLDRLGQADAATSYWCKGSWNAKDGYPNAVTSHFGRMVYARDLTVWFSTVTDGESFGNYFNADDEAFTWLASQARQNPIRWLLGERTQNLYAGTLGKIMELRSLDELAGFTPANPPKVASAATVPCAAVFPVLADSGILFLDRTAKHLHELVYDSSQEAVTAPDLTYLAGSILGSGVVQLAAQTSPYPTIWAVRTDGRLASCYYSKTYGVAAWSTHTTDGLYTSVAVIPSETGDQVWTAVNRDGTYMVEYLSDVNMVATPTDGVFLDSSISFDGGDAVDISAITKATPGKVTLASWPVGLSDGDNVWIGSAGGMTQINDRAYEADDCDSTAMTLTLNTTAGADLNTSGFTTYTSGGTLKIVENAFGGLAHLNGRDVSVLADGVYVGEYTVDSNSITIDEYANTVRAGLNYTSVLTPIEVEAMSDNATTRAMFKSMKGLLIDVYHSIGGTYGLTTADTLTSIPYEDETAEFTGPVVAPMQTGANRVSRYTIHQAEPLPLTVTGVVPIWEAR